MRGPITVLSVALLVPTSLAGERLPPSVSCAELASLALPNTRITKAEAVAAGAFTLPAPGGPTPAGGPPAPLQAFKNAPAFCRVAATLKPSTDSDIKIEVWLPVKGWNGKFVGVGNGGWAGTISYGLLAQAVRRGYAAASTDTGHAGTGGDGSFAFNHPEKLIDFGYRAVHGMTVEAKAVATSHYGKAPRLSYWNGCSTGGRQGLMEAQRYPTDYDAVIAGAPANYMTHLQSQALWVGLATLKDPASLIPREKYPLVHEAVMQACDRNDGVADGVLEDPPNCTFDPRSLQCAGDDTSWCLTEPQVEAARKIYSPLRHPTTRAEIFPGLERGSEKGWAALAGGPGPLSISNDYFRYVIFKDPSWDFRTLDFAKHVALAEKIDNRTLDAIDPNLGPFFGRGGRLFMYHGWNDQLIPPRNSINYYNSVVRAIGGDEKAADLIRLFMVPGMNHCAGGDGVTTFDPLDVLEQWVEQQKTPDRIVATRSSSNAVVRSHPLCSYPQIAVYTGSGSTDEASNFVCKAR
jgi:feruloyl esterase